VFTEEMFVETLEMKRDGLRGKKLAKSMAEKFSGYSAEELKVFAEHVPSPELRRRARAIHSLFLTLLGIGSVAAAVSVFSLFSEGDRGVQGLALAGLVLLFRLVPIYMVARYRRDGALLVFLGAGTGVARQFVTMDVVNLLFAVTLAIVAWLWVEKLFPKLTWRGQLR
jgi:hypothetical protein